MALCVNCAYCGNEFEAVRSSAKYCSDTCRVKYNNLPKLMERDFDGILERIESLSDILQDYPEFTVEIDDYLQRIRNACYRIQYNEIDAIKLRNMQNERNNADS